APRHDSGRNGASQHFYLSAGTGRKIDISTLCAHPSLRSPAMVQTMVRNDILEKFPDLFGAKKVNGREVNVEEAITTLTRELRPSIEAALTARRETLASPAPVRQKYGWPKWDTTFADPVTGKSWTERQIVQGMIDNFLGRESQWRWRLNDEVPIPADAHPTRNPGLELTGP